MNLALEILFTVSEADGHEKCHFQLPSLLPEENMLPFGARGRNNIVFTVHFKRYPVHRVQVCVRLADHVSPCESVKREEALPHGYL